MLKEKLEEFQKLRGEIYEAFKYSEQWRVFPLTLELDAYWFLTGENSGDLIVYSSEPFTEESIDEGESIYSVSLYACEHLSKQVFKTATHTMILGDTECENNIFLFVFDNSKKCTDAALIDRYWER